MKNSELEKVVINSGLELSEGEQIKQSYLPFFIQIAEIKEDAKHINFENPSEEDEKKARELRLRTVKIRTGSAKIKDERKKIHLLKGNLEQSSYNLIKTGCELEEEMFFQLEKKRENEEMQRIELLVLKRTEKISMFCSDPSIYPLSRMTDDEFNAVFITLKEVFERKIESERIEAERIETERKAELKRIEDQRIENEKLKAEAIEREKQQQIEREKAEAILKAERKKKDELIRIEREKAEAIQEELKNERLKQLQIEEERKAEEERLIKIKIEKENAPIKEKLNEWIENLKLDKSPVKNNITIEIQEKFDLFKDWAKKQVLTI